jgi:hypothetical protein
MRIPSDSNQRDSNGNSSLEGVKATCIRGTSGTWRVTLAGKLLLLPRGIDFRVAIRDYIGQHPILPRALNTCDSRITVI